MSQEPDPEVQGTPVTARSWQDPPFNRWAFWHVGDLLPTYRVPRGDGVPRPLPAAAGGQASSAAPGQPDLLSVPVNRMDRTGEPPSTGTVGGINDFNVVVGGAGPAGATRAFIYSNGKLTSLGSADAVSEATAINFRGQVVGTMSGRAFLYENGSLRAIRVVDITWELDVMNRPIKFAKVEGSEREIPCQRVFLAMGFLFPQHTGMLENLGVELDERKNVKAKEGVYRTNVSKVFACGDMRRGQSLVVWAISEGREAARKVDEFLMGHSVLESKDSVNQFAQVF